MLLLLRINLDSAPVANAGSSGQGFLFLTHLLQESTTPIIDEDLGGGSGYPVYGKYERPKSVGEFLDVAMSEIYEAGTDKELPIETREAFAKIVKPYTKAKTKIPDVEKIDWATFESDITRIEQMLALWEQVLEEEDLIIMAYLQYYH
jgi:hypothetical protein